uniref:5'-3' exonuclease PLD3-like n=1 Tax=Pristiophorus japonicus TaxID=55135 RepID=UPI00398E97ED
MPRKGLEPRRRSRRLKDYEQDREQILNPEPVIPEEAVEMEPEEEERQDLQSKPFQILTPRNPIRGRSRIPRSRVAGRAEEEEEEKKEEEPVINVKPVQVVLRKLKAEVPPEEEEEEEEEAEAAHVTDAPRSITPPPVVKEDLRPAMMSLRKLREKIPEEPRKKIIQREFPKIPTLRPTQLGARGSRGPSCCTVLCYLAPVALILALGSWYLLGFKQGAPSSGTWGPVGELKMDWIYSVLPWQEEACQDQCSLTLVESIPVGLLYPDTAPRHASIYQGWMDLLSQANETVQIAAFYFTLRGSDLKQEDPTAAEGEAVLKRLAELKSRGVGLKIAVNSPQQSEEDTNYLEQNGAEVRRVVLKNLTGGIVHTKLWVVDGRHVYIGSANMDWRSLTQVKELGVVLSNCSCLARDVEKVFEVYWQLGGKGAAIPKRWPSRYNALSSRQDPLRLKLNGIDAQVYVSSAPPSLCSPGRTTDLEAILSVIDDAREFVFISVMDFLPLCRYCDPVRFWPAIEDRLREAACVRKVSVRLLISCWAHSYRSMFVYLESLNVLSQEPLSCPVQVKLFQVPATEEQKRIPFSRVNHNKYMVTDRIAYIGTSNWSEDYFIRTAGVGLVINQTGVAPGSSVTVQSQLQAVFERDWNSEHASDLGSEEARHCLRYREGV